MTEILVDWADRGAVRGAPKLEPVGWTLNDTAALLVLLCLVGVLTTFPVGDYDTFWHLANGREMVSSGRIVQEELFSFTRAGQGFHNHEWLAQLLFQWAFMLGGVVGMVVLKVFVVSVTATLLYLTLRFLESKPGLSVAVVLLVVLAGLGRYTVRPQIFSYLFLAFVQFLIVGVKRSRLPVYALWSIPPVLVLWDCLHGAVFGLVVLAVFFAIETKRCLFDGRRGSLSAGATLEWRFLLGLMLATIFAVAVNPYGLRSYGIFLSLGRGIDFMSATTQEFLPVKWGMLHPTWALLGMLVLAIATSFGRIEPTQMITSIVFGGLALRYSRAVAVFGIVCVPVFATAGAQLQEWLDRGKYKRGLRIGLFAISMAIVGFIAWGKFFNPEGRFRFGVGVDDRFLPVGAAEFIERAGLDGNMFNTGQFGGYLAWRLYPARRIFQYNLPWVFGDLAAIMHTSGWLGMDRYNIEYAIVPVDEELWDRVFVPGEWVVVYWEAAAKILVKAGGVNARQAAEYELRYYLPGVTAKSLRELMQIDSTVARRLAREIAQVLSVSVVPKSAAFLGQLLASNNDLLSPQEQIDFAQQGLRANPESGLLWAGLGNGLYRQGKLEEAEAAFDKVLKLDPRLVMAVVNQGYVYYDQGRFARARELFRRAVRLGPEAPEGYFGLALVSKRAGDREAMIRDFQKVIEVTKGRGPWAVKAREHLVSNH